MYLVLDIETSGLPEKLGNPKEIKKYEKARMIEIGYMIYDEDLNRKFAYTSLINSPEFHEFEINSQIHGISHEMLEKKGNSIHHVFRILYENITKFNVKHLVAHNICFDYNIVLSEIHRAILSMTFSTRFQLHILQSLLIVLPSLHHFCTMAQGRKLSHFNGRYPKLSLLHHHLTGTYIIQTHRALDDVLMCFQCFQKLQNLSLVV